MKYKLKNQAKRKLVTRICINCGKKLQTTLPDIKGMPNPNTTRKFTKGAFGFLPGTKWGCRTGSHNFYFDYELERLC